MLLEYGHKIQEVLLSGQDPVGVQPKEFDSTIVCTPSPAVMMQFLRPMAEICEPCTCFCMGDTMVDGKLACIPDFPANETAAKAILIHKVRESTQLAKLLSVFYAQFKDDFTIRPFYLDERS